ncbi:MAG TPA: tetratricopeptide repeat protein [Bryobacteraceae bacterium]|nr:tetratricopeptide repeat protein [Bryobacteraceae bacterium]
MTFGYPEKIVRFLTMAAVVLALVAGSRAFAQQGEDAWKDLVMRALNEASAKDYGKSEQSFLAAVKEAEKFGAEDPRVGTTLNSLGLVYRAEKKYADAETSYRKALAILLKSYGVDSMDVANVNFNIATVLFDQGHQPAAMPFLQRTLVTYENILGSNAGKTASVLCMLGDIRRLAKDYQAAEGPLKRCADIREANGGMQSNDMADALYSLALTYIGEGKYALAEPRLTLVEKIREQTLGIMSPALADTFEQHATLLRQLGRDKDAEKLSSMAAAIRRGANNATSAKK